MVQKNPDDKESGRLQDSLFDFRERIDQFLRFQFDLRVGAGGVLDQFDQFESFFEFVLHLGSVAEKFPANRRRARDLAGFIDQFAGVTDALFGCKCFCHKQIIVEKLII